MGAGRTDEFRRDAVRIALTSGLTRLQVAEDLGVGLSTLNKWVTAHRDTDVVSPENRELARGPEDISQEEFFEALLEAVMSGKQPEEVAQQLIFENWE